ncbi:MAG: hypothetical protein AAGJ35_02300 [Myxococcota bacterium]
MTRNRDLFLHTPFLRAAQTYITQHQTQCMYEWGLFVADLHTHIKTQHSHVFQQFSEFFQQRFVRAQPSQLSAHILEAFTAPEFTAQFRDHLVAQIPHIEEAQRTHPEQKEHAALTTAQHGWSFQTEHTPEGTWFFSLFWVGWLPHQGPAKLLVADPLRLKGSIQHFWKLILQQQVQSQGGMLLHASGFLYKGQAHVFAGTSGSGKTTTVRHAPPEAKILSDEMLLIRPEGTQLMVYGTPFYGDYNQPGEMLHAPLANIHFIERANQCRKRTLSPKEAFPRLMRVFCSPPPRPQQQKHILKTIEQFLPFCDLLHMTANRAYWSHL